VLETHADLFLVVLTRQPLAAFSQLAKGHVGIVTGDAGEARGITINEGANAVSDHSQPDGGQNKQMAADEEMAWRLQAQLNKQVRERGSRG